MHELIACTASVIILALFIFQSAANTNTFIRAVYCERTVSDYLTEEYEEDEIEKKLLEMKYELERMPGIRAELSENKMDLYLEGVIGPAKALGISDNSIHIEKEIELKVKAEDDEKHDDYDRDPDAISSSEQDPDGDERDDYFDDMTDIVEGDNDN